MCTQTIAKTQAVYNRSRSIWQVIAPWGEIINEFPSGPQGKRAAELETLRTDDPGAYDQAHALRHGIFSYYAETHSRLWKAARIVADGQVYAAHPLSPSEGEAYHVHSQSEAIFYTVTREGDLYTCTCPDYDEFHAPTVHGQKLCKHIFAVKITKALKRPFPAYLDSPRDIWRFLEETQASYKVIGAYNRHPHLYAQPQQRPAVPGEIIQDEEGDTYRITHNGQRFGHWKISIDLPTAAPQPAQPPPITYEGLDAIAADRIARKRQAMSSHNHDLKRMQRQQAEKNAVKAYEQKKARANAAYYEG